MALLSCCVDDQKWLLMAAVHSFILVPSISIFLASLVLLESIDYVCWHSNTSPEREETQKSKEKANQLCTIISKFHSIETWWDIAEISDANAYIGEYGKESSWEIFRVVFLFSSLGMSRASCANQHKISIPLICIIKSCECGLKGSSVLSPELSRVQRTLNDNNKFPRLMIKFFLCCSISSNLSIFRHFVLSSIILCSQYLTPTIYELQLSQTHNSLV